MGAVAGRRSAERVTQSNGEERRVVPVAACSHGSLAALALAASRPGMAHAVRFAPARRARGRPVAARRRRWSVPVRGRDGGAAASPSEPRLTRDRVTVRGRRAVGARPLEHEPAGSGTRCRSATRLGTLYGFGAYRLRGGPRTRLARRPPGAAMGAAPRACSAQRCRARVRVPPVPCWRLELAA